MGPGRRANRARKNLIIEIAAGGHRPPGGVRAGHRNPVRPRSPRTQAGAASCAAGIWLPSRLASAPGVHFFSKGFPDCLSSTGVRHPGAVRPPGHWDAKLSIEHHFVAAERPSFATIQVLLGIGDGLAPDGAGGLAASIAGLWACGGFGECS